MKPGESEIAVVGPFADQTRYLLGNYTGTPTHIVSVLDGLKPSFRRRKSPSFRELNSCATRAIRFPTVLLTNARGQPGLKAEYSEWHRARTWARQRSPLPAHQPQWSRNVDLEDEATFQPEAAGKKSVGVQWTGFLTPPDSGEYLVGMSAVALPACDRWQSRWRRIRSNAGSGKPSWDAYISRKDKRSPLNVIYWNQRAHDPHAQLIWAQGEQFAVP